MSVMLETVIKCPRCGYFQMETMPAEACVICWKCPGCAEVIRPKPGDCCVYCSHASNKCPAAQAEALGAAQADLRVIGDGAARRET